MKNITRSPLQVRPMRRYRRPVYPCWQGPNPMQHPDLIPYPFRKKALQVLAASGLVSAFLLPTTVTAGSAIKETAVAMPDSLVNPFPLAASGLPYHAVMFGTGLPERLEDKEARQVIERAFATQGLALEPDYRYRDAQGHEYLLDGYDPARKVGFVFIDYARMGKGTVRDWAGQGKINKAFHSKPGKLAGEGFEGHGKEDFKWILNILKNEADDSTASVIKTRFENALALPLEHPERQALLRRQYVEYQLWFYLTSHYENPDPNAPLMAALLLQPDSPAKTKQVQQYLNLLDIWYQARLLDADATLKAALIPATLDILQEKKASRRKTMVQHLDHIQFLYKHSEKEKGHVLAMLQARGRPLAQNLRDLAQQAERIRLDMPEIEALAQLPETEQVFIAAISQQDARLGFHEQFHLTQKEIDFQKKRGADAATIARMEADLNKPTVKDLKLQELDNMVQQYIAWARSQGRF